MSKTSALRSKMMRFVIPGVYITGHHGQTNNQVISHNGIAAKSPSSNQGSDSAPKEVELKKPKSIVSRRKLLVVVGVLAALLVALLTCVIIFNVEDLKEKIEFEYKHEEFYENGTRKGFDPSQLLIMAKSGDGELKATRNQEGQLRLRNGNFEHEGRLEVYHNGEWGTICDDKFNLNTAHVACKQMGFPAAIWRKKNAFFGQGRGPIWLDDVRCNNIANKDNIVEQCAHRPWGRHNCHHREDVAVRCRPMETPTAPEVRLVGGDDDTMGTVEVLYNNQWGSICDDRFDDRDAKVICNQLGKPHGKALAVTRALYGQSDTNKIWLDSVECNGEEDHIGECRHDTWGRHDCAHYEDAGVVCTDEEPTYNVRLRGGKNALEGRVEVNFYGRWGTVCDDRWDDIDAMVVCRELGYTGMGHQAFSEAAFGEGSGFIVMDEVRCEDSKMSLAECAFGGWGVHDCVSSEDAGVRCVDEGPDAVDPIITCPNDQPESGATIFSYSAEGTTISFPAAVATDLNDAGSATMPMLSYQVLTSPPGDVSMQPMGFFPIGITTVEATATDNADNTASCRFDVNVTLTDGEGPWQMLAEECGRPNAEFDKIPSDGNGNGGLDRIIEGDDVSDLRTWPWAVYIGGCGAELISRNWAITAAHCVHNSNSPAFVTVGVLQKGQTTPGFHQTRATVFEHPNYDSRTIDMDIALLKLEMPVMMFTDYVRPVCMATTSAEQATYSGTPEPCYVIGWGTTESGRVTNNLQEVTSPLLATAQCREDYEDPRLITDNMICTATERENPPPRGSCQGDSGGPMMCKHPETGTWDLVGITSWGFGCADARYPDVLARVSKFRSFIRSTIDENGGP